MGSRIDRMRSIMRLALAAGGPREADRFVGMYVNDWTLDFGPRGRQAVTELLAAATRRA